MSLRTILNLSDVTEQLAENLSSPFKLRETLRNIQKKLDNAFLSGVKARELIRLRSQIIDNLLTLLWSQFNLTDEKSLFLAAVGGYGRAELHPASDIDILILTHASLPKGIQINLISFLTFIWDLGLQIGHSVRTLDECIDRATNDSCIYTNLLDLRFISGDKTLYQLFKDKIISPQLWDNESFLKSKLAEKEERYQKYNKTAYQLEPDIKNGPGAIRDTHLILWLIFHFYKTKNIEEMVQKNIYSNNDYQEFLRCNDYLSDLRYAIHLAAPNRTANTKENRLYFDKQTQLSKHFGYKNSEEKLAVEKFMHDYYLVAKKVYALNEMTVQYFKEQFLKDFKEAKSENYNELLQINNSFIGLQPHISIKQHPELLLDLFLILAKNRNIKGLQSHTIYQLRKYSSLIDESYRKNSAYNSLFLSIFRQSTDISLILQQMNRYKILSRYLPDFDLVTGQSQYDLFHLYTVDQHTLFVIKNLCHFNQPETAKEFPLCVKLMEQINKPELLYLAGLFHDIGKGRKRNHAKIGAIIAKDFAVQHQLSLRDKHLIYWLVKDHLLMSFVAQRRDINSHEVIRKFAKRVKTVRRLNHLYLLTVADIRATNETLWNSWKDALLKQLYFAAKDYLENMPPLVDKKTLVLEKQNHLLKQILKTRSIDHINEVRPKSNLVDDIEKKMIIKLKKLWENLGDDYLLRETNETILWHTSAILKHSHKAIPLVAVRTPEEIGATEIFLFTKDRDNLFATTTAVLDRLHLNIMDARIITSRHGYSLDTYTVLDENSQPIYEAFQLERIIELLTKYHSPNAPMPSLPRRRIPRELAHFTENTRVTFHNHKGKGYTEMTVLSPDRPGLLARIGAAFMQEKIRLTHAKIVTLVDNIEDIFCITDYENKPILSRKRQIRLRNRICYYLKQNSKNSK